MTHKHTLMIPVETDSPLSPSTESTHVTGNAETRYDTDRHEHIVQELAAIHGLPVTSDLLAFYESAYATAVYDIADRVTPEMTRNQIITCFAPPRQVDETPSGP